MNKDQNAAWLLASIVIGVVLLRFAVRYICLKRFNAPDPTAGASLSKSRARARKKFEYSDAHRVQVVTRLILSAAIIGCALVGLGFLVVDWTALSNIDRAVNQWFEPYRASWLVHIFIQVTSLGTMISMTTILVVVSALLWAVGRPRLLLPCWVAFVGAEATTWITKYGMDRARPDLLEGLSEMNPSFPSGHATASTVVFGFLGFVICREFPSGAVRAEVAFWSAVAICIVCFSRMFLSLHYLSDVVSGVCVGSLWLLIGIALNEWQKTGRRHPHAYQHHRHK